LYRLSDDVGWFGAITWMWVVAVYHVKWSWLAESFVEPTVISECSVGKRDVTEAFKRTSYAKYLYDRCTRLNREHLYIMLFDGVVEVVNGLVAKRPVSTIHLVVWL
jgi:hypothetical protein